jgi:2-hydroxy-6-oxonona-2,4-dienedioate hydrolase
MSSLATYPRAVGDHTTRVLEAGSGESHIVFVHGVGSHAWWWRNNLVPLADEGFHSFAIDLPGHGFGPKGVSAPEPTVHGYADFVRRFVGELPSGKLVLVGHSLGGHIVAELTASQTFAVSALVMVAPTGIAPVGEAAREATRRRQSDTSLDAIRAKLLFAIHDPRLVTEDWVHEDYMINNSPGAVDALRQISAHIGDSLDDNIVGGRLAPLTESVPTLLVWGRDDRSVILSSGREARRMLPAAHMAVIDATAHVPSFEAPDLFNAILVNFLRGRRFEAAGVSWE